VSVTFDLADRTFRARLTPGLPGAPTGFTGRWTTGSGLVLTAIVVP
jgi:hypothetical protein